MTTVTKRLFYVPAAFIISLGSLLGFFLIHGEPKIESLFSSGHTHVILFAMCAILFVHLLNHIDGVTDKMGMWLAVLTLIAYILPIGLLIAGYSGDTAHLKWTTPLGGIPLAFNWMLIGILTWGRYTEPHKGKAKKKK